MTFSKLAAVLAMAAACLSSPVWAKDTGYQCTFEVNNVHKGWLPQALFIGHKAGAKVATIADPIILHYNDRQPITGKVVADTAKKVTFAWEVVTYSKTRQRARMNYRATHLKGTKTMTLSAQPLGYANNFVTKGTCKIGKLKG